MARATVDADLATDVKSAATPAPRARRQSRAGRNVLRVIAVGYVGILVLVPLLLVVWRTFKPGLSEVLSSLTDPLTVHAFKLTAIIAVLAVILNTIFGVGVGLLLARYSFPGRRLLSAFIDLPIAISPIVVGLALILVYGPNGWFATPLSDANFSIIGAIPGMVLATVFVSLPLVVREVVPVLEEAGIEQEQAAQCLGAGSFVTFRRITLPTIRWALAYGVVLSLARALGEYGAVLVVSGNIEGSTETATLRIDNLYEYSQQTDAAYAITFVLVAVAIVAIIAITIISPKQESA
ncbi:sulfate transport system permease protein [Jatrophihabitans sp. GAS493]|uniref:sulfate ABC transporter permease n=1 Tax=Jatrophihabitans sp. GAS493 TaxID=1907575 RepID=UPI000BC0AC1E|nr:sulfate ABC transporter permease subunit [Jatrophihabitans sp. GAS493]SOD74156.1 sulfate transport system permease protein [Jatrophihabitans sp. GAS493]